MGVLLRGVKREQLKRGQIIAVPGSIKAVRQFQAQLYVLTKDEGLSCVPCVPIMLTDSRWTLHTIHVQLPPTTLPPDG